MIKTNKFRGDVEALRGIAVLLVVLFHMKIQYIPSGFIGVDIFFVISGYLMAVAFSDAKHFVFSFYERRARRVLPAALIIMMICFLMSPLFFLPFESGRLAEQVAGMLLFIPNVIFWKIDDYFSALNFAPMLHYWSLGVELQYYLVFPLLVCLFKNSFKWFLVFLGGSLLICIIVTPINSKTAFFMLPTRLWEFLLGYFSYYIGKVFLVKNVFSNVARNFIVGISTALLVAYALYAIPKEQFPGVYAIPAAFLSFLIIAVGVDDKYIESNVAILVLRWFGKLSYSIYLIHYPVIFVFVYQPFSDWKTLDALDLISIIIITLMLSILSYKYIETPFRDRKKFPLKKFIIVLVGIYVFLIGAIIFYEKFNYFSGGYPVQEAKVFKAMGDTGNFRCSKWQKIKEYKESSCYLTRGSERSYYLVGDSHMDALKESFVGVASKHDATVRLNKARCFLGESQCSSEEISEQVKKFNITDVVLHGWAFDKFNYKNLQKLIDTSADLGVNIHIIGPVPTYKKSVPRALFEEARNHSHMIDRISREQFLSILPSEYLEFKNINQSKLNVFFYMPENYLCPNSCLLEDEKGIYYYDDHHLTITGASVLIPMFEELINNFK